jgi:3-oxoacyl-[acyl-carrier protein] reductase
LTDLGLTGKTALVSGSTRGVGLAVAAALARAGARVAVNYLHNEEAAKKALEYLLGMGTEAVALKADVSREGEALGLIGVVESELGPVDILVNNAHGRITRTPFTASTWDEHQAHLDGILKPAYNLTHAAIGPMKSRGWGRVVNMGNNMVMAPVTGYSAYTSAMAAMLGFTRNLAAEAGRFGVTVNMVSPGFVMTEEAPNTTEAVRNAIAGATPLGRLAVPDDVAFAVLFFCSELGRFVTGANLSVDGGKTMS